MSSVKSHPSTLGSAVIFKLLITNIFSLASVETLDDHQIQGLEWILNPHNEYVYSDDMLNLLNGIETLETIENNGRRGYYFDTRDVQLLTKICGQDVECMGKKSESIVKYNKKLEALQCLNAAIVKYAFTDIKYLKKGNTSYHNTTGRMLSLLYKANIPAHNWLWTFHLRMELNNGYQIPGLDSYFPEDRFLEDIDNHLDLCRKYEYLPVNFGREAGELNYEKDKLKALCRRLYHDNTVEDTYLSSIYSGADQFRAQNFALSNVNEHKSILVKKIEKIDLNWEYAKIMLSAEKSKIMDRLFGIRGYYNIMDRMVRVNVLYLMWIHFEIVKVNLKRSFMDPALIHTCNNISSFKRFLEKPMVTVFEMFGREHFVLNQIARMLTVNIADFDSNKSYYGKLKLMNNVVKNVILEILLDLKIPAHQVQMLFNVKNLPLIGSRTDVTTPMFTEHLEQLDEYLNNIKSVFPPFVLLQYFINGHSPLMKTFFMYK